MESVEPALPIALLGLRKDTLIVGLAGRQEMIENASPCMGGSGDGFGQLASLPPRVQYGKRLDPFYGMTYCHTWR